MTDPRRPALFSTGIDASDVTKFLTHVVEPAAKVLAEGFAELAIEFLAGALKTYTPDQIDAIIDKATATLKEKLKEEANG